MAIIGSSSPPVFYRCNAVPLQCGQFSRKYSQKTGELWGFSCGSSIWLIFCRSFCIYVISDNIWPPYNGTRLYAAENFVLLYMLLYLCHLWWYHRIVTQTLQSGNDAGMDGETRKQVRLTTQASTMPSDPNLLRVKMKFCVKSKFSLHLE